MLSGMTSAQLNHSSDVFNLIRDSVRKHTVIVSYERQHLRKNVVHNIAESGLSTVASYCCQIRYSV